MTAEGKIEVQLSASEFSGLRNALERQLGRYKGTLMRQHSSDAPPEHRSDLEHRAATLAELLDDARDPEFDEDGLPVLAHSPNRPELLHEEVAKLYAEFGPESRSEASQRSSDGDCEAAISLLAAWGHRA